MHQVRHNFSKSFVQPPPTWSPAALRNRQKGSAKFNSQTRENMETLYVKHNIEKLYKRRQRNLLKIMFDQRNVDENIEYYRPDRILRSKNNVKLKSNFTRITKIQRSPYHRGINLWDKLPRSIQCEKDKKRFKKAVNQMDIK